jgi:hypothetical protein
MRGSGFKPFAIAVEQSVWIQSGELKNLTLKALDGMSI